MSSQITLLLNQRSEGDELALGELMPLVYDELRMMARRHMSGQESGHTLQTTALIHEAYLKLAGGDEPNWGSRAHFFSVASKAMRHILVDHARSKNVQRRGNSPQQVTLNETAVITKDPFSRRCGNGRGGVF